MALNRSVFCDVKADKAGEYTVKVTAYDVNGNKAEQSYKVTVKEKPKEPDTPVNTPTNNNQSNTGGNQSSNGGGTSTSRIKSRYHSYY